MARDGITLEATGALNAAQQRHLLIRVQYADKLLSEIEEILTAASSKSPFPKYQVDVTTAQSKVIQDYIARIRAQTLRVLEGQQIAVPGPQFGAIHCIRVTLAFVRIALTEIGPKYMRGYGEVPESAVADLNGLVTELNTLVDNLNAYLAQGLGQDLGARLAKLEWTGDEATLLQKLERIFSAHGLVEFRSKLAMILDRLETRRFEIAVFGRVSSGKSSLLNHILQFDALPVGVNPITAVPTRLPEETSVCIRATDDVEKLGRVALRDAALRVVEQWRQGQNADASMITAAVQETAAAGANQLYVRLDALARDLTAALQQAAQQLDVTEIPQEQELGLALREMPQLDFGGVSGSLKRSPLVSIARPLVQARVEGRLRRLLGPDVSEAFRSYRQLLEAWVRRAIAEVQARFDSHADTYRAQLDRLLGSSEASPETAEAIRRDLADIRLESTEVGDASGR